MKHPAKEQEKAVAPGAGAGAAVRGTNQSGMRARNERLVLSLVRRHKALAKSELARMTGLSAQAISVMMRSLESQGLLLRGEPLRGRVGQPSIPMALNPDGALFYGLKIGRRSADLILIDLLGQLRDRAHVTYEFPRPDATIKFATAAFARMQKNLSPDQQQRVSGLGVAMPFRLWEWAAPEGVSEDVVAEWKGRDIRNELCDALGVEVSLQNDATAACGAELVFGDGDLPPDFLYFYVGYFIGGGVVLGNRLFTGPTGNAGALGSMPVATQEGATRQLLDVASLHGLETGLQDQGIDASALWVSPSEWQIAEDVLSPWLAEAAMGIANAVASAGCVLDIDNVVIDGWMPESIRDALIKGIEADLRTIDLSGGPYPSIIAGTVGPDARSLGAASLPLSQRFLMDAGG